MAEQFFDIQASGGDYTSLQSAEDDQDSNTNTFMRFRVEDFEAGESTWDGFSTTPTAAEPIVIEPQAGDEHDGTDSNTGAYVDAISATGFSIKEPYITVSRMRVDIPSGSTRAGININLGNGGVADGNVIDGCLVRVLAGGQIPNNAAAIRFTNNTADSGQNDVIKLINNVVYGNGEGDAGEDNIHGINVLTVRTSSGSQTVDVEMDNNAVHEIGLAGFNEGFGMDIDDTVIAGSITVNLSVRNNVITDTSSIDLSENTSGSTTVNLTGSNNCTSDATGDDLGASGSHINEDPADLYVSDNDLRPKDSSSVLQDGGITLASVVDDCVGAIRSAPYDIGAFATAATTAIKDILGNGIIPFKR